MQFKFDCMELIPTEGSKKCHVDLETTKQELIIERRWTREKTQEKQIVQMVNIEFMHEHDYNYARLTLVVKGGRQKRKSEEVDLEFEMPSDKVTFMSVVISCCPEIGLRPRT
mmetsp:Transcript_9552/g.14996  ORF Transcript_9552/g.14996 Transcript_9552/m.14996 type:complete len:112 (+) Transcript_9552:60-395(+)